MLLNEILNARKLPQVWPKDSGDWDSRREEIKEILQHEVYGFRPGEPEEVNFTELPADPFYGSFCSGKAPLKKIQISGRVNGKKFSFPMYAAIPREGKNLPFFVLINFRPNLPNWYAPIPAEEIIDNGFALFCVLAEDATSDSANPYDGLAAVAYNDVDRSDWKRTGSDCGKIALWSWAASRVMDYCQTVDCLDLNRGAVVGHSRMGKTALLTGMLDERFRYVISNNSGCTGAAISRGKKGETVAKICDLIDYWFAPNYKKYADREGEMPFDQHFLLAAIAPRYVYVASAETDYGADPDSEYLSCCAASEVYERLGMTGFVHPDRLPLPGDVLQEGNIGYHMRSGGHFLSREDWNHYFEFIHNHK